ncbi:MAG: MotA/TolQ/ExbB proton channel family protein [Desulfobacteraceae bacterium]|nr:MotA/TolQ/ExbB proton channel family protein [Desulfobacteraceae bacterium]MDH3874913.1 MotA/TolQ/ExbB proton channel family protein [Desulfobacteraceae bacterium]MDH3882451.1 MotA/TolQ/ExbB proton channel family protein [Desulfobacteraceae bacterium]
MIDFLSKGGILVIPILFCSVVALAIFMERLITIFRERTQEMDLEEKIISFLKSGKNAQAIELAKNSNSPMSRILNHAIEVKNRDWNTLETVIGHATQEEVRGLSKYLQALATIGNVTPLLGLLGTVIGMIKAFMVIQEMGGKVNAAVLAGGIWEAMLTTALGLSVALPTMIGHSYLVSIVEDFEARLQSGALSFIKTISRVDL